MLTRDVFIYCRKRLILNKTQAIGKFFDIDALIDMVPSMGEHIANPAKYIKYLQDMKCDNPEEYRFCHEFNPSIFMSPGFCINACIDCEIDKLCWPTEENKYMFIDGSTVACGSGNAFDYYAPNGRLLLAHDAGDEFTYVHPIFEYIVRAINSIRNYMRSISQSVIAIGELPTTYDSVFDKLMSEYEGATRVKLGRGSIYDRDDFVRTYSHDSKFIVAIRPNDQCVDGHRYECKYGHAIVCSDFQHPMTKTMYTLGENNMWLVIDDNAGVLIPNISWPRGMRSGELSDRNLFHKFWKAMYKSRSESPRYLLRLADMPDAPIVTSCSTMIENGTHSGIQQPAPGWLPITCCMYLSVFEYLMVMDIRDAAVVVKKTTTDTRVRLTRFEQDMSEATDDSFDSDIYWVSNGRITRGDIGAHNAFELPGGGPWGILTQCYYYGHIRGRALTNSITVVECERNQYGEWLSPGEAMYPELSVTNPTGNNQYKCWYVTFPNSHGDIIAIHLVGAAVTTIDEIKRHASEDHWYFYQYRRFIVGYLAFEDELDTHRNHRE